MATSLVPTTLAPWQRRIARWTAAQLARGAHVSIEDAYREVSAKRKVRKGDFKALWRSPEFTLAWDEELDKLQARANKRAKVISARNAPLAMALMGKALRALNKELQNPTADPLAVARVTAQLTTPIFNAVNPKKVESTVNQSLHITLSSEQFKALEAPETVVSAEDVVIIPNEEL